MIKTTILRRNFQLTLLSLILHIKFKKGLENDRNNSLGRRYRRRSRGKE